MRKVDPMTRFSNEYKQKYGFGGWDDPRPTKECLMCNGTGIAPGDGETECGFCINDNDEESQEA